MWYSIMYNSLGVRGAFCMDAASPEEAEVKFKKFIAHCMRSAPPGMVHEGFLEMSVRLSPNVSLMEGLDPQNWQDGSNALGLGALGGPGHSPYTVGQSQVQNSNWPPGHNIQELVVDWNIPITSLNNGNVTVLGTSAADPVGHAGMLPDPVDLTIPVVGSELELDMDSFMRP